MRFEIVAIAALAATASAGPLGCNTIDRAVTEPCSLPEMEYDYARRKVEGLKSRGVDAQAPIYQKAVVDVRETRERLRVCEIRYG